MPMREEIEVISAVCKNKDIHVLFEHSVDPMMRSCGDVWDFVKDYYNVGGANGNKMLLIVQTLMASEV